MLSRYSAKSLRRRWWRKIDMLWPTPLLYTSSESPNGCEPMAGRRRRKKQVRDQRIVWNLS